MISKAWMCGFNEIQFFFGFSEKKNEYFISFNKIYIFSFWKLILPTWNRFHNPESASNHDHHNPISNPHKKLSDYLKFVLVGNYW